MNNWTISLELDAKRNTVHGSTENLSHALTNGADLRINTAFYHNEHIDPLSTDHQLIEETSDFPQTIILDSKWAAGIMTFRQPVSLKIGFGAGVHLSLFLYNHNGQQALARLVLDKQDKLLSDDRNNDLKKMHIHDVNDQDSAAPSKSFIYDFEYYKFYVNSNYKEIYANDAKGNRSFGSIEALAEAYRSGKRIKIGLCNFFSNLYNLNAHQDEIFLHCGCSYYYRNERLMIANTNPFVSLPGRIPLVYTPRSINYCWAIAQTNGIVHIRRFDPFEQQWITHNMQLAIRWFAQA